jgi:hypothetical protein
VFESDGDVMTDKKQLTDEELRRRVAAIAGWMNIIKWRGDNDNEVCHRSRVPDYPNDLGKVWLIAKRWASESCLDLKLLTSHSDDEVETVTAILMGYSGDDPMFFTATGNADDDVEAILVCRVLIEANAKVNA